MTTMNLRFAFEKETKGAVRFQEVGEHGKPAFSRTCVSWPGMRTSPAGLWSHGYAKPRSWAARCPAILDSGMTGLIRLASHWSSVMREQQDVN